MPEGSNALSVSAALSIAKRQLEDITVRVVGEVSEVSANARYKAVYFTVKDEKSSLPCMIWNNRYASCGFELQVGALVEMTGRFTLYAAKGRMNFDAFSIELAGEGKLRMQVANLAKKLQGEGLLEVARKQALPPYPQRIGLVTSPSGAAVHDVLRTLRRRYPLAEVVFAGVGVEGKNAPQGIIGGLQAVEAADVDVVLLVRGGGSFEDLMPFNDEALARHIAAMDVPVVTGIGHEPDTSIADLVADFRASTPTAAAESVAPSMHDILAALSERGRRMQGVIGSRLASSGRILDRYAMMPLFQVPMRLFQEDAQRLDDMTQRLNDALPESIARKYEALARSRAKLSLSASRLLAPYSESLVRSRAQLSSLGKGIPAPYASVIASNAASLDALSPLAVLARGYAIARDEAHGVVKSVDVVAVGEKMSVQLVDGIIDCEIDEITVQQIALEDMDG